MSRTISELLAAEEPLFSLALRDLEKASGQDSVDVRLTSDIMHKFHGGLTYLALDPNDSIGQEVYYALLAKVDEHDKLLATAIGAPDNETVRQLLPLIKSAVDDLDIPKSAWVLKRSVAKELIRKTPPKNVMKHLKYRSVESMLKSENMCELFGAMRFMESPEWMESFIKKYKTLKPSDFETRDIEIILMPADRYGEAAKEYVYQKRHNITYLKELGAVIMLPVSFEKLPGLTLTALPMLLHCINEIRLYSAYFKLQQVKPKFGQMIVDTLTKDPGKHAIMAGQHVHWRVIHRFFGRLESEHHPEIFQPHVQPEDLEWRRAEDTLFRLHPTLSFWKDNDYVGALYDGRPVSLNLFDMAVSYMNRAPYEYRAIYHFREALWNELYMRYMGQKALESQVLSQLDTGLLSLEKHSSRRRKSV